MEYRERRPPPSLAPILECLWELEGDAGPNPGLQPVLPDGCAEAVLHVGEPFWWLTEAGLERQPRAVLAGPLPRAIWLRPPPRASTLGIRFRPGRLGAWVREPARVAGRVVPLGDVWGGQVDAWLEVLGSTPVPARLPRLEELLCASHFQGAAVDPLITACADQVLQSRGASRVDALVAASGLGPRQFGRRFEAAVGLGPKRFARMARVHAALLHLRRGVDLSTAALRAGYADHAHFTRDFAALAGLPPRRFRAEGQLGARFTSRERLLAYFREPA